MYIAIKVKIYKVECTLTKMYNNKVTIYKAECTLIRMYVHLESFMCLFNRVERTIVTKLYIER